MKFIKSIIFVVLLTFTTHAFAKSSEYYQKTLLHVLTECNNQCQKQVFEQEIESAFIALMQAVLNQLNFALSQQQKEKLWSKDL